MIPELRDMLRDDVVYVTVVQDDAGLSIKKLNILFISVGGFGHIAIPLIKGQ
jgi:hypothetical protein